MRFLLDVLRDILEGLLFLLRSPLVDQFLYPVAELTIRRPEGLADGYRVVDDLIDRRIPLPTGAIVEHGILAHGQVLHLAHGYGCYDLYLLVEGLVLAVAIDQEHTAQSGLQVVLRHVGHAQTEMACALVDIERTGLEDAELVREVIEVLQRHEVMEQQHVVAAEQQQLTQRHVLGFGVGHGFRVGLLGRLFRLFPSGDLRTHLQEFLLGHTGFYGLLRNRRQPDLLEFVQFVIGFIFLGLSLMRRHDIRLQRCVRNRLFVYLDGFERLIYVGQGNEFGFLGLSSTEFLRHFEDRLVGYIVELEFGTLTEERLRVLEHRA